MTCRSGILPPYDGWWSLSGGGLVALGTQGTPPTWADTGPLVLAAAMGLPLCPSSSLAKAALTTSDLGPVIWPLDRSSFSPPCPLSTTWQLFWVHCTKRQRYGSLVPSFPISLSGETRNWLLPHGSILVAATGWLSWYQTAQETKLSQPSSLGASALGQMRAMPYPCPAVQVLVPGSWRPL